MQGVFFCFFFFKDVSHPLVSLLLPNSESLNPMARDGLPPYELLVREAPEALKTVLAIVNALICPPELDGKTPISKNAIHFNCSTKR